MIGSRNQLRHSRCHRHGFAWLEVLLALAIIALVLQLFPAMGRGLLWAIDVRNWSRSVWFSFNALVLIGLVLVRFGPQLYLDWRQRRERVAAERAQFDKQRELKEQREALERLQRSRARRMY